MVVWKVKKDQIIALLELGWSFRSIAKEVGCSISAVSFHANNLDLLDQESKGKFKTRYNWKEVQRYHDEGRQGPDPLKGMGLFFERSLPVQSLP